MGAWARRRRAASGVLALATMGAMALVVAPAYGQSAGIGNSGDASARTGGNSSVGNASDNTASGTTNQSVVGGLLGLVVNLSSSSTNASNGTSNITTGSAQASGNNSDTAVGQSGGGGAVVGTVLGPVLVGGQSAGVSNSGGASADTGGNSSAGNASRNVATNTQTVSGGLINIGLSLGQSATNVSNGTSNITTGPAQAAGNQATTEVSQFRAGGGFACDGFFGFGGERVEVANRGVASSSTGSNAGVGNQSRNVASNSSTVGGGLINVGVPGLLSNTAANVSDGQSNINTGPASAVGNRSTTEVVQECGAHADFVAPPVIVPGAQRFVPRAPTVELARTGVDPFILGLMAFSLLFGGFLFLVWSKLEALPRGGRLAG